MELAEFKNKVLGMKNKLYRYAVRMTGNYDDSEDIVQETFIKMWQIRDTLKENPEPLAWRILRNLCIDRLRAKSSGKTFIDVEVIEYSLPDNSADPGELLENTESAAMIESIVNALPVRLKEIFHLREIEGLANAEIGELMDMTENALKTSICRIRKHIREILIKKYKFNYEYGK